MTYLLSVMSAHLSSPPLDGDITAEFVDKFSAANVVPVTSLENILVTAEILGCAPSAFALSRACSNKEDWLMIHMLKQKEGCWVTLSSTEGDQVLIKLLS